MQVSLPFRPGSGNYDVLKELCGDRTRPAYNKELRCFEVAREHLTALIERLPTELGQPVQVVLHGATQTKCVEACWNAAPETRWNCLCSCAGRYHGSTTGPPTSVSAELAVETVYTTHEYTVRP